MDGYEELIKTKSWDAIRAADTATFEAYRAMQRDGFGGAADYAYQARLNLATAENILRAHFKHRAHPERDDSARLPDKT